MILSQLISRLEIIPNSLSISIEKKMNTFINEISSMYQEMI
jgi:hypothetical protein